MSGLLPSQSVAENLGFQPLAGRIGAKIDNIRLAGDLPDAAITAIEAVLSKYKVIFFRNQGHLDDAEQERFAARPRQSACASDEPGAPRQRRHSGHRLEPRARRPLAHRRDLRRGLP